MTSRADIVTLARSWIGTPFHHQGRVPRVALDCVGVLACTMSHFGMPYEDVHGYAKRPDGTQLMARLSGALDAATSPELGNVLVFDVIDESHHWPMHVALRTDVGMLHAYSGARRKGDTRAGFVIEHPIDERWAKRLVAEFQFRGLEG